MTTSNTHRPGQDSIQAPASTTTPTTSQSPRKQRPNYNLIHRQPLPIQTTPLPAFLPHNPLSLLRVAYALLSRHLDLEPPSSHPIIHTGYYDPFTNSVNVTDPQSIRALWEQGFFGKGSLSRSEPEWEKLRAERRATEAARAAGEAGTRGDTAAEVTRKRREERKRDKLGRARLEAEILEEQLRVEGKLGQKTAEQAKAEIKTNGQCEHPSPNDDIQTSKQISPVDSKTQEDKAEAILAEAVVANSNIPLPQQEDHLNTSITGADSTVPSTSSTRSDDQNQEHLQLTPSEAFFLVYALGVLTVHPARTSAILYTPSKPDTTLGLLTLFSQHTSFPPLHPASTPQQSHLATAKFLTNYTVYHHYRSLGWTIRSGIKFGVDYLLYYRGPAFSHAEFAILIIPDYSSWGQEQVESLGKKDRKEVEKRKDWWWLHAANRVQSQVRKTLVLCYVEVPPPSPPMAQETRATGNVVGKLLKGYRIREFVLKRWSPNRDRG